MTNDETLAALTEGHTVGEERIKSLSLAIEAGADYATLEELRDATRVSRTTTIVLPVHRYEMLSRGRGWARKGVFDSVALRVSP